jgi:hypothetical protein
MSTSPPSASPDLPSATRSGTTRSVASHCVAAGAHWRREHLSSSWRHSRSTGRMPPEKVFRTSSLPIQIPLSPSYSSVFPPQGRTPADLHTNPIQSPFSPRNRSLTRSKRRLSRSPPQGTGASSCSAVVCRIIVDRCCWFPSIA